ncbi:MAG: M56 family metallopeptidase [Vicinamibacterales bacterium]
MIAAFTNHLWQSTLFVLAAALVAAALRQNGAHVRHAVWVVASLKFLVPFALLMSIGGALPRLTPAVTQVASPAAAAAPELSLAVDRIAEPFTGDLFSSTPASSTQPAPDWIAIALLATWACGFVLVALMRLREWQRIRAAVRASAPMPLTGSVPVRAAPGLLEPGVVGVWRPVLLMPAGIERHLTPAQLRAVLEHELCHIRRRDNLTAAIHMAVEAVFWFHPLVWWVGARMVDERERACDEQVLRVCGEPQAYAESILNVCKLYVESPLACVSGVTGSDLKKRVAAIMVNRVGLRLNFARKAGLTMAATLAVVLPVAAGMLTAPLRASDAQAPSSKFDVVSIKPCAAPSGRAPAPPRGARGGAAPWAAQTSPGYVYWDCVTLAQLIDQAYSGEDHPLLNTVRQPRSDSFQPKRVRGGPSWTESDRFTVEVKGSIDLTTPALAGRQSRLLAALPAGMSQALRAMLEDRFQLKVRRAKEQQEMYALRIGKNGLNKERMKPTKPGDCLTPDEYFAADPASRGSKICGRIFVSLTSQEFAGFTMAAFAQTLSTRMDRYVLDETGLEGPFNFVLQNPPSGSASGEDRTVLMIEALGLRIERTKGPAEFLVIESVQKPRPDAPAPDAAPPARARGAAVR